MVNVIVLMVIMSKIIKPVNYVSKIVWIVTKIIQLKLKLISNKLIWNVYHVN